MQQHLRRRPCTRPAPASMFPAVHAGLVIRTSGSVRFSKRSLAFSPYSLLLLPGLRHLPRPLTTFCIIKGPSPESRLHPLHQDQIRWVLGTESCFPGVWVSREAWEVWRRGKGAGFHRLPATAGQGCCPWSIVGKPEGNDRWCFGFTERGRWETTDCGKWCPTHLHTARQQGIKKPLVHCGTEGSFVVIGPARAQRERTGLWQSPGAGLLRYWQ